jgi:hypothetical protein
MMRRHNAPYFHGPLKSTSTDDDGVAKAMLTESHGRDERKTQRIAPAACTSGTGTGRWALLEREQRLPAVKA